MYVETDDGSLKEQTIDIDSNRCCGRGYAAHCLRTYGATKNTSALLEFFVCIILSKLFDNMRSTWIYLKASKPQTAQLTDGL